MTGRYFGMSIMMMGSALILSGGMAFAEEEPPLPPVPAEYADKHMPAGGWTDPKAIEDGALIYSGEINPQVNCGSCHGKDGKPVKKGARDMRDPKNICRWSDSFWYWRISEGVPKTKMKAWKSQLSEEQIWHVMAFENQFSNEGKPHDHSCYKP
jgi:mono/diheme cytochrome c family protein